MKFKNKTKNDIKCKNEMKEICTKIENDHRKLKSEKNKKIQEAKMENLIKKIEEKSKKVHYFGSKRVDRVNHRFNSKKVQKKEKGNEIKKKKEGEDLWDFLDGDSDGEDSSNLNNNDI